MNLFSNQQLFLPLRTSFNSNFCVRFFLAWAFLLLPLFFRMEKLRSEGFSVRKNKGSKRRTQKHGRSSEYKGRDQLEKQKTIPIN